MRTDQPKPTSDPYRPLTRREHKMGGWLFISFGLFFIALFFVERGWSFRWVILALAAISIWYGALHLLGTRKEP